jgi:DUF1680 family protein
VIGSGISNLNYSNYNTWVGGIIAIRVHSGVLTPLDLTNNFNAGPYETSTNPPPPAFAVQATLQGNDVLLTYSARVGLYYWVQMEDSMHPSTWRNLGASPVQATNSTMTYVHTGGAGLPVCYYRVLQLNSPPPGVNVALTATDSTSYVSSWETLTAMNDGYEPTSSSDHTHGCYGNWNSTNVNWVEYDWTQPIMTSKIGVYWWADGQGIAAPSSCYLQYWNGSGFVNVNNPIGLGVALNQYNYTTFTPVTTTKLRLYIAPSGATSNGISTGIIEWKVFDNSSTNNYAPIVGAVGDRDVIAGANTFLNGSAQDDGRIYITPVITWNKVSGPGNLTVADPYSANTTGSLSAPGNYVLQMAAFDGQYTNTSTFNVTVAAPPPATHPLPVYVSPYRVTSSLWNYRLNKTLTNWIPHLYAQLNNTNLAQGNINSFMQVGNKLAGKTYTTPSADPYADAYTLNTVESMCYALMYDAQGDPGVIAAQNAFRTNLNYWIPIILSAQLTNGYLHTYCTLRNIAPWSNVSLHEGYVAGYFIEAGLAHYLAFNGTDPTLYNAAKKLADCWYTNIYVGQKLWFDGHENMEQALVHLGRFMNEYEGPGTGQKYITLSKYLMDMRGTPAANAALGDGQSYDQSHLPTIQQYEILGHAVRAEYLMSAIQDVAIETADPYYQSAALSLWDNYVSKKYYVQGGAGSGETSEGFGGNYSLRNNAYCETCAGCGTVFFFHKMNLGYQDARHADLLENVLYNEVLGSLDDQALNLFYPNPLNSSAARVSWTGVPCCYGNASRTLFQLPTWIYTRSPNSIYVNLFIGSTVTVSNVAGTTVQMVQDTEYPWTNTATITVNPTTPANFTLYVRVPNRTMSALYTPTPAVSGLTSISLNGAPISPSINNGYAAITRTWTAGDHIDLALPLEIQRIKADNKIAADVGLVALQYGPLIYNVESADQNITTNVLSPLTSLSTSWTNSMGGMLLINGTWTNGSAFTAIPNYARLNRGGSTAVWFKDQ